MTVSGVTYKKTRPRGLAPWKPQRATVELLDQVHDILTEYRAYLPLTIRQVFYRLVGAHGYDKTEQAYGRLCDKLVRARRAGVLRFEDFRDDGVTVDETVGFESLGDFYATLTDWAGSYRRDRQAGQPQRLEVWCEAGGMVPMLRRAVDDFGIPVVSSGGYDSLTVKHDLARRFVGVDRPTVVLHVGDYDPSGCSIIDALAGDVIDLAGDIGAVWEPRFVRVAATPEQIARYDLPTKPAKDTDKRGDFSGLTTQAEALEPADLIEELRQVVFSYVDLETWREVVDAEEAERADAVATLDGLS